MAYICKYCRAGNHMYCLANSYRSQPIECLCDTCAQIDKDAEDDLTIEDEDIEED